VVAARTVLSLSRIEFSTASARSGGGATVFPNALQVACFDTGFHSAASFVENG
jgi:hypothetical protein